MRRTRRASCTAERKPFATATEVFETTYLKGSSMPIRYLCQTGQSRRGRRHLRAAYVGFVLLLTACTATSEITDSSSQSS